MISAGKLRGLMTLADGQGIFKMIAVDQRPPIFRALAKHKKRQPHNVRYDEVASVKTLLTKVLAPEASAVLIDPVWTHPHALLHIPGKTGLLSTLEGYDFDLIDCERWSHPIKDWSVKKIKRSGAAGVKVLAWHRPDVRADTQAHQDAFIQSIGDECRLRDIPFVLELLIYPINEDVTSLAYAKAKPKRVLDSVRYYTDERFGIDLLKLEFPAELKYTKEFSSGAFDGQERKAAYSLADVEGFLQDLDALTHVPWVLLSAGVGPREFSLNLELAFAAGASGFLAGRAVWFDTLALYPDMEAIEQALRATSLPYLRHISALADRAKPWQEHKRYGGHVEMEHASRTWVKSYGSQGD